MIDLTKIEHICERKTAMVVIDNAIISNKVVYDINDYRPRGKKGL